MIANPDQILETKDKAYDPYWLHGKWEGVGKAMDHNGNFSEFREVLEFKVISDDLDTVLNY